MNLQIVRGIQKQPVGAVIYGWEGIGKTSLAAQFPNPLILDVEGGSHHLDVARVECGTFADLMAAVIALGTDARGFQTIVIDSIDRAEQSLCQKVADDSDKRSIEDFGFGRGYVMVAERMAKFLEACDHLLKCGLNVVLIAHAGVKRVSPPDQTDGFDRFELRMLKQTAPLVKEWADLLLFLNWDMRLVEGQDGKKKAVGGKARKMYAERSAAFDAKNRYGLPAEMPLGIEPLAHLFAAPPLKTAPPTMAIADRIARIRTASADALPEFAQKIAAYHAAGDLTSDQRAQLETAIQARREELEALPV